MSPERSTRADPNRPRRSLAATTVLAILILLGCVPAQEATPKPAKGEPSEEPFATYTEKIPGSDVGFVMVPIGAGTFLMGSPEKEPGHEPDEAPQHQVQVDAFWMGRCEVTWNEFELWMLGLDTKQRELKGTPASERDRAADAVTRPSKPYTDMTFGMGHDGHPAISMTQLAARTYCEWLSAKTGRFYRLPSEAEWEYACRAGTTTAYSFGDDPSKLGDYAWFAGNSGDTTRKVGLKKPNPWGLHDLHGNVMEWTLDQYHADGYARFAGSEAARNPLAAPVQEYAHVVRGGSWRSDPEELRSAARVASDPMWKMQDPQIPQSRWYFTDALFVGFRVVRPLKEPQGAERGRWR